MVYAWTYSMLIRLRAKSRKRWSQSCHKQREIHGHVPCLARNRISMLETKCPPRLLRYCPAASCEANPIHRSGGQFLVERRAAEGGFGSSKRFALFDHGFTALRL